MMAVMSSLRIMETMASGDEEHKKTDYRCYTFQENKKKQWRWWLNDYFSIFCG